MLKKYFEKFTQKPNLTKKTHYLDLVTNLYDGSVTGIDSYRQNVIVYRSVNLVSQTASHVPWQIFTIKGNRRQLEEFHPAAKLLKKPSSSKGGADFFTELISSKLLFGNAYILASGKENISPKELYLLPSQNTSTIIESGKVVGYKYHSAAGDRIYTINPLTSRVVYYI